MKLNIGGQKGYKTLAKNGVKDWTIVDVRKGADIIHDVHEGPMPIGDESVDAIYTSHTFEHIFPDKLTDVLKDCRRVLKPGGKIRIVVPNIERAIRAYVKGDSNYLKDKNNPTKPDFYPNDPIYYLMSWFMTYSLDKDLGRRLVGGHVNVFNPPSLRGWLSRANFKGLKQMEFNENSPEFKGCDFPRYKNCSIYMEATK